MKAIQVNVDDKLLDLIVKEGDDRRRKLGPTIVDILIEYFKKKKKL